MKRASIHFACPDCGRNYILPVAGGAAGGAGPFFTCDRCGFSLQFHGRSSDPGAPVEQCSLCGNREFYVQKDFNRALGLWLVVISAMVALLVMVLVDHLWGLAVLAGVTAVDALIFKCARQVTVCYLCHAVHRGFPGSAEHRPYYLGTEERFKKLRNDWLVGLKHEK